MNGHGYINTMRTNMIKIDEIYQALFVPYIFEHCSFQVHDRKYGPSALVHVHEPFGRSDPESIKTYIKGQESVGNHVYLSLIHI